MNAEDDNESVASCDAFNDETFDVDVPDEEWEFDGDEPEDAGFVGHEVDGNRTEAAALVSEKVVNPSSLNAITTSSSGPVEYGDGILTTESIEKMIEMSLNNLIDEKEDFVTAVSRRHVQNRYQNGAEIFQNMRMGPALMSERVTYERQLYAAPLHSMEVGPQQVCCPGSSGRLDGYSIEPIVVKGMKTVEELEAGLSLKNEVAMKDQLPTPTAPLPHAWLFNGGNSCQNSSTEPHPQLTGGAGSILPAHPVCPVGPEPFPRPFHGNGSLPPFYANPIGARTLPHPLMHPVGVPHMRPAMSAPRGPVCPVVRPPAPGTVPPDVYRNMPNPGFGMADQRSCPYLPAFPFPRYSPNARMPRPFGPCHFEGAGFPGRFFPVGFGPARPGMQMRPLYPRMGPPGEWCHYPYQRGHPPRGGSWISRVMSNTQISEQDDYYYRTWCQKKGVHPKEEEAKDSECDSSSAVRTYEPPKFEGSLGSIQQITTEMPRRLLVVSSSPTGQMVSVEVPNVSMLNTRKSVLLYVDNLFLVLLADDCDNNHDRSKAAREMVAAKLRPHLGNSDILRYVLQVAKGQELFARYLKLTQHNVLLLLNSVVDVLPALMAINFSGEALNRILAMINRSVQESGDAELRECLKIVKNQFKSLSPGCAARSKVAYSVALCVALRCSKRSHSQGALFNCSSGADPKKVLDQIIGASAACPLTNEELKLFGSRVLRLCKGSEATSATNRRLHK